MLKMKKLFKVVFSGLVLVLTVSCTSTSDVQPSSQRQGQLIDIQLKLRETAMQQWESDLPKFAPTEELATPSPTDQSTEKVAYDEKTVAWRASIAEPWKDLQGQKNLDFMCQLWFEGWLGIGDTFADTFAEHRARTEAMGLKIETIEAIRMAEDNRKTVNYPSVGKQTKLFICEAITIFRLARPGLTQPARSTISFVMTLVNNEVKANFSVTQGISTSQGSK
jgi:hypothetical protein